MISLMKFPGHTRLRKFVGHRHGAHEAWNRFRIDGHDPFRRIGRDHDSSELVGCRIPGYCRGLILALVITMASGKNTQAEYKQDHGATRSTNKWLHISSLIHPRACSSKE